MLYDLSMCLFQTELSKECVGLKNKAAPTITDGDGLLEELQVVRSERDKAVGEGKTLRQNAIGLERDKQVCNYGK